jgi:hypothetical protein
MRESARRAARAIGIGLLGFGLLGMGGLGGGGEAPPTRDYRATFTDVDGKKVEVNRVTTGADASIEGDLGRARLRIPFDNITGIRFHPVDNERDRVRGEIDLREGEPVTLTLRSSTTFYGRIPAGAYQIRARDLQSIDFAR